MIIESLHIDRFAGLTDFTVELSRGLNIIEGKNESGKSTVAAFIKFLFYGLSGTKNGEETSERERYMPFDSSYAGGSATILLSGKRYVLERRVTVSSGAVRDTAREEVSLFDESSGEKTLIGKDVGQELFGVSSKVFTDTAYFRQLADTAPAKGELYDAIGNILFSGDEKTDAKKAIKRLDELRTALRHKKGNGGELAQLEEQIRAIRSRLESAEDSNRAIIALEGEIEQRTLKLERLTKRAENAEKKAEAGKIKRKLQLREEKRRTEREAQSLLLAINELCDGKLPSAEDVARARIYASSLPIKRAEIEKAEREETRIKSEMESLGEHGAANEAVTRFGGAESLLHRAKKHITGFKTKLTLGAVMLALTVITAVLTVFLSLGTAFFAVPSALAVLGIVFTALAFSDKRKYNALSTPFGDRLTLSELTDKIEGYKQDHGRFCELSEAYRDARIKSDSARAELENELKLAASALSAVGECGTGEMEERLSVSAERAEMKRVQHTQLKAQYLTATTAISALEREMGSEGEEELKMRLSALGVDTGAEIDIEAAKKEIEFYRTQAAMQEKEIYNRKISLAEHKARAEDPFTLAGELNEGETLYARKTRQYKACVKALEALEDAAQNLRGGVAPYLSDGACRRLSRVTGGKYSALKINSELSAVVVMGNSVRSLDFLSAGTRDLAYISLRLALVELLYKREKPPLVFDESFAHQDKGRTALALKLLSEEAENGMQSLVFTCRNYEAQSAEYGTYKHITFQG
ncbi:MAG: AAA family ATPase [Clostridia bacterium]|nr:AAA family ATPase [Clostridia bacterium]